MEALQDMICAMMNSNSYVENHGEKDIIILVLIDLIKDIKEAIVFVMK